jgi:hypothetical protein
VYGQGRASACAVRVEVAAAALEPFAGARGEQLLDVRGDAFDLVGFGATTDRLALHGAIPGERGCESAAIPIRAQMLGE